MKKLLQSKKYKGSILVPSSKSYMQRAIAIATLAHGSSVLRFPAWCNDTRSALSMAKEMGAVVEEFEDHVVIRGLSRYKAKMLNAGESGLGLRMFTPVAALSNVEVQLQGEGSLTGRPVTMLEAPLRQLGCSIRTNNGFVPVYVKGPLEGGTAKVDGRTSSQLLTGLLIALPYAKKDTQLQVLNLKSIPYVDMTMQIMRCFGVEVEHEDYKTFDIQGQQQYKACEYEVEGDWSGAAFHLVAGAIAGDITLNHLSANSQQADKAILDVLQAVGAEIEYKTDCIRVTKNKLNAFEFDATHCPDLFPPLAVLAAACKGTSRIKGVSRLKHKESDRARVLVKELGQLGVIIKLEDDFMIISGGSINGGVINSNNDHRIAMAGAIASLIAEKPVAIEQAEAVNKSYPGFWDDFDVLSM